MLEVGIEAYEVQHLIIQIRAHFEDKSASGITDRCVCTGTYVVPTCKSIIIISSVKLKTIAFWPGFEFFCSLFLCVLDNDNKLDTCLQFCRGLITNSSNDYLCGHIISVIA